MTAPTTSPVGGDVMPRIREWLQHAGPTRTLADVLLIEAHLEIGLLRVQLATTIPAHIHHRQIADLNEIIATQNRALARQAQRTTR
jgi:hypothetical protein